MHPNAFLDDTKENVVCGFHVSEDATCSTRAV